MYHRVDTADACRHHFTDTSWLLTSAVFFLFFLGYSMPEEELAPLT